jgi:hypothetical protein
MTTPLLFDNVRVFLEINDQQEEERLRQELTKNGASILERPDEATNNYYHIIERSNWVGSFFSFSNPLGLVYPLLFLSLTFRAS